MSKLYNFIDCNFFEKDEQSKKNAFNNSIQEFDSIDSAASNYKPDGILDPNVSVIEVKDIKSGS